MAGQQPGALVVGAGMAGAACARILADAGHAVTVLDKGRSLGGRLAQRRSAEGAFDHGAQYMKARDPGFRAALESWVREGAAAAWPEAALDEPVWIGTPAMNQPVVALLRGIATVTGWTVAALERAGGAWWARDLAGRRHGPFERVALALPAPQAAALLAGLPQPSPLAAALDPVVMAPCWALMLAFEAPLALPFEALRFDQGAPLAWAARHRTKPGRGEAETWIVHAGPAWSRGALERSAEEVAPALAELARQALGTDMPEPRAMRAHRWRYALVERPLGRPFLLDPASGLGLCGDWCLGPRVEAAFLSGCRLGEALAGNGCSPDP